MPGSDDKGYVDPWATRLVEKAMAKEPLEDREDQKDPALLEAHRATPHTPQHEKESDPTVGLEQRPLRRARHNEACPACGGFLKHHSQMQGVRLGCDGNAYDLG